MKIKRKEITVLEMLLLIKKGAKVKLQTFLHRLGQRKQVFRTRIYADGTIFYCYHYRPFPFMVSNQGRILNDEITAVFQNKSGGDG